MKITRIVAMIVLLGVAYTSVLLIGCQSMNSVTPSNDAGYGGRGSAGGTGGGVGGHGGGR